METIYQPEQNNYVINIYGLGKDRRYAAKIHTVFMSNWQALLFCYILKHEVPDFKNIEIEAKN